MDSSGLRAQRPPVGDEHPAYAPAGAWLPLPLPLQVSWLNLLHFTKVNIAKDF